MQIDGLVTRQSYPFSEDAYSWFAHFTKGKALRNWPECWDNGTSLEIQNEKKHLVEYVEFALLKTFLHRI